MKDPGKNSRCLSVLSETAVNKSVGQVQTAGDQKHPEHISCGHQAREKEASENSSERTEQGGQDRIYHRCLPLHQVLLLKNRGKKQENPGDLCKYGSFDIREPVYQSVSFYAFCSGLFWEDQGSMIAEVNATPMSAFENKKI